MLALKSYEQNNGFSDITTDELYFINGGSATEEKITLDLPSYESKPREDGTTFNYNGITVTSGNKDFSIKIGGSIQKPSVTFTVKIYL